MTILPEKQMNFISQKLSETLSEVSPKIKNKMSTNILAPLQRDTFTKTGLSSASSAIQCAPKEINLVRKPKFSKITDMIISSGGHHFNASGTVDCGLFEKMFGIKLYSPTTTGLNPFKYAIDKFIKKEAVIPEGIDGILIGHGEGSYLDGTWRFVETQQNVMDYINSVLPKGKKMLVFTCETAENATQKTPGIGNHVITSMSDAKYPAKIVESGKGIIGHFLNNQVMYY